MARTTYSIKLFGIWVKVNEKIFNLFDRQTARPVWGVSVMQARPVPTPEKCRGQESNNMEV